MRKIRCDPRGVLIDSAPRASRTLKGRRHLGGIHLPRAQHIDSALLQELNRLLHQRNGNRIRRVGAVVLGPIRPSELARTATHERINQQPVAELISKVVEGR